MATVYSGSLEPASSPRHRLAYAGLLATLFVYLFYARTFDSGDSFVLLRDQIRDWRIALGSFASLPLTGPQSTAGGSSLGPVYYWVLWLSRTLLGPFASNLPHAGAWGIAALQGAADLFLLDTLRRRTGSTWIAVSTVLLAATSAHDLAVSATIWNPAVSVAFAKVAIAVRLRFEQPSLWTTAAATAAAWFAVQAHSAAIFIAMPVTASYVVEDLLASRPMRALQQVRVIVEVIVLLQLPFLLHLLTTSGEAAPTRALAGAASGSLRLMPSSQAALRFLTSILSAPWRSTVWTPVFIGCVALATFAWRRSVPMLAVTIGPLAATMVGFSLWQGNYDEYWYLPLAPCAALMVVLALTWWRPRVSAVVLTAVIVAMQPGRVAASLGWYRMREYRPIVAGAKRIIRQTHELRRLETSFPMPPLSDPAFPYEVLGGTFSEHAGFDAVIDARGDVQFRPVQP